MVTRYAHYDTSGDVYLPVMLNSVVHIIMYGYYFCGASGFTFQNVRVCAVFNVYSLLFVHFGFHSLFDFFRPVHMVVACL